MAFVDFYHPGTNLPMWTQTWTPSRESTGRTSASTLPSMGPTCLPPCTTPTRTCGTPLASEPYWTWLRKTTTPKSRGSRPRTSTSACGRAPSLGTPRTWTSTPSITFTSERQSSGTPCRRNTDGGSRGWPNVSRIFELPFRESLDVICVVVLDVIMLLLLLITLNHCNNCYLFVLVHFCLEQSH